MIIAITNQKGGVGKTTTAINLAAALAQMERNTLLIDMDPQANASISFLQQGQWTKNLYDVLIPGGIGLSEVICPSNTPHLSIAPASISLAKIEPALAGELDAHFFLRDSLAKISNIFDYVVIDTPPALGMLTVNALVAASHVLIPIQSSYFALEGTDDLIETIDKIKRRVNPNLQILGVLLTIYDGRTVLSRDIYAQIQNTFGPKVFKTIIHKNIRLEEAPAYRESIFSYDPASRGALEYYQLAEEVLSRV